MAHQFKLHAYTPQKPCKMTRSPLTFALVLFLSLCAPARASPSRGPSKAPPAHNIILRNLAKPRFFGAAANTTFLFHDANYTKVIETQVSLMFL